MCGTPADVFKHPINTHTHTHKHPCTCTQTNQKKKKKKSLYSNVTNCRPFIPAMIDP